jgi:2EXR family
MESNSDDSDEITSDPRSESSEKALPEFKYFGQLPTKIRLRIWTQVCLEPCIIDLWVVPTDKASNAISSTFYYATHSHVPSILGVSRGARKVGLEHYTLEFGTYFKKIIGGSRWHRYRCLGDCSCRQYCRVNITRSLEPHTYVNSNCDIIYPMPLEAPLGYNGR